MLLLALLISSIGMPAALRASEFERGGPPSPHHYHRASISRNQRAPAALLIGRGSLKGPGIARRGLRWGAMMLPNIGACNSAGGKIETPVDNFKVAWRG